MRPLKIALAATMLLLGTLFFTQYARSMNIVTPRDSFFVGFAEARNKPLHPLWFYIAGIISGANAANIILTGEPTICDTHPFEDTAKTEEVVMRWLLANDLMDNPDILLEVAVPLAFEDQYPCQSIKA